MKNRISVKRAEVKTLLQSPDLRKGHMLEVAWPRLTEKRIKALDGTTTVEPAGTIIRRRLILRNDWTKPTPSKSFVPAGGHMFNVATKERAEEIKAKHQLALFMSLEGVTHPHGEKDHPVNVPVDRVIEIHDTHTNDSYIVVD